jgi:competence protein ComEA
MPPNRPSCGPLLWILAASALRGSLMAAPTDDSPPADSLDCHTMAKAQVCCLEERTPASVLLPRHAWALGARMNVNRASADELTLLPGIGPQRAKAIVSSREHEGPFLSTGDLERVRGIGPATRRRLRRDWATTDRQGLAER